MSRVRRYQEMFGDGEGMLICDACFCTGGYEVVDTPDSHSTGKCHACGTFGAVKQVKKKV